MLVFHTLEPIYFNDSKVLILGSMPFLKSRELGFYYSHPTNKFWTTLEKVYDTKIGSSKEEKIMFLKKNKIALFDVLQSCEISSSSDSSIKNPVANDLSIILNNSSITTIFTTGRKAYDLYKKLCYQNTKIEAIYLPSTSSANCPKNIDNILLSYYKIIKEKTDTK